MSPHPFPPIVRWMVYPALAALAGAGGGLLAASMGTSEPAYRWAAIAGGMSLGAALGAVLTRRTWVSLVAAPAVGLLILCAVVATAMSFETGRRESAFDLLRRLLRESNALLTLGAGLWLQAAAAHAALRPPLPPPWLRLLVLHGGAALLAAAAAYAGVPDKARGSVALLFFLSTAAQAVVVRASVALAQRLQT